MTGTGAKYLRGKGPVKLVYKKKFLTVKKAQAQERLIRLKKSSYQERRRSLNTYMNKRLEWFLLIILAAGGIFLWCQLSLPRYQSIDLSVSQAKAIDISKKYLEDPARGRFS